MSKLVYKVVKHDGGWAYEALGTFSETYRTREAARTAARLAAAEQSSVEAPTPIEYEDEQGRWHREVTQPNDRPKTVVKG
jgi:hypothetical protein